MTGISKTAHKAILALHEQWLERELAQDAAGVLAYCTDDVVWLPPSGPALRGSCAIRAWLATQPITRIGRIDISQLRVEGAGALAYKLADFAAWVESPTQSGGSQFTGTHLWVLREVAPSRWKVVVVSWSITSGADQPPA